MEDVKSFEEVENKLEEMFAGIEEDAPTSVPVLVATTKVEPIPNIVETGNCKPNDIASNLCGTLHSSDEIKKEEVIPIPNHNDNEVEKITSTNHNASPRKRTKQIKKKSNKLKKKINSHADLEMVPFNKSKATKEKINKTDGTQIEAKHRGPCVQVKLNGSINIINSLILDDDGEKQSKSRKPLHGYGNTERSKIRGLHISTLSNKYDADTTDKSWICVYCKLGPHKLNLGDLYGPYIVTLNDENSGITTSGENYNDSICGMIKLSEINYEIWAHEDCAVWAPGVFLVGSQLIGLEESIWSSSKNICIHCNQPGAVLFCLYRGCSEVAHFPCAQKFNWLLNEKTLKTYCKTHSIMKSEQLSI